MAMLSPKSRELTVKVIDSRRHLIEDMTGPLPTHSAEAEGGCGVIGIACSEPIPGRHLLQALRQMRNRGNGKGGGAALAGLDPAQFGVSAEILRRDTLLAMAYLQPGIRQQVEASHIHPGFVIDHVHPMPSTSVPGLDTPPPEVVLYFGHAKEEVLKAFAGDHKLLGLTSSALEDEWVYQNSYSLNKAYYASLGEQRAFVLSHGKDLLALKMVGFGDDVIEAYGLHDIRAHVWIGHHRYPTKGRVWHPGGAHPFVGLNEALVHNGDFANYASVCAYLAQQNIRPLFLTDTEVSVLVFDLLHRTYGYPLEYVIEALAPTTERDFAMLPPDKQEIYQRLQTVHMHGSPDGPWFFLIAQSAANGDEPRSARLIGITDTSMLRPQVFALQATGPEGPSIGFAASEKQAIDAALGSLASEDARFWPRPDKVWNARGGSHTDGGAFVFDVSRSANGKADLVCRDKFGRVIELAGEPAPQRADGQPKSSTPPPSSDASPMLSFDDFVEHLAGWSYADVGGWLEAIVRQADGSGAGERQRAIDLLALMIDRRYSTSGLRRSALLSMVDAARGRLLGQLDSGTADGFLGYHKGDSLPDGALERTVVLDARGFAAEGPGSLAEAINHLASRGVKRLLVHGVQGHRFIANGLGSETQGIRIDVYGSPGDYLGSGIDGAEVIVHGSAQDQLAQIMKSGRLVIHGDVGQTFMYAAKGGEAYVLGDAAGRPLINAVGSPRVVINGTCLDYLAESFMAGDPLHGGGFVVLNGMSFSDEGRWRPMETPYPGGNLFSLASGGAIYVRDPRRQVGDDQLNGGAFVSMSDEHWQLIEPVLRDNEALFGISVETLLTVDGELRRPVDVYRAIIPMQQKALMPEEAWVTHGA
jgi:glutamate synthase domain-containing protein 1/glutamate synthase domain-containing protein 3